MYECSKCGGETKFVEGVSKKNGKHYQGYKCLEAECGNLDFIDKMPAKPAPKVAPKPEPRSAANGDNKTETMCLAYAKDLIVAQIAAGTAPPHPVKSIIWAFRLLLKECKAPGSVVFKEDKEEDEQ